MNEIWNFLSVVIPNKGERIIIVVSGLLSSWLSFAIGGFDLSIQWLFIFVIIDYITGTIAAFKSQEWNSSTGFKGLFKKVFLFFIIALCNGIDKTLSIDVLRNAAIMAYAVNEVGSILENIEHLGYGKYIPSFLRRGLKVLKEKENELFKEGEEK